MLYFKTVAVCYTSAAMVVISVQTFQVFIHVFNNPYKVGVDYMINI